MRGPAPAAAPDALPIVLLVAVAVVCALSLEVGIAFAVGCVVWYACTAPPRPATPPPSDAAATARRVSTTRAARANRNEPRPKAPRRERPPAATATLQRVPLRAEVTEHPEEHHFDAELLRQRQMRGATGSASHFHGSALPALMAAARRDLTTRDPAIVPLDRNDTACLPRPGTI